MTAELVHLPTGQLVELVTPPVDGHVLVQFSDDGRLEVVAASDLEHRPDR